jgi:hypothetical protein
VVADLATLPAAAFGGALGVVVQRGHLRSEVAFALLPGRTYSVSSEPGVGADMSLWAASATAAYVAAVGQAEIALGGGAQVDHADALGVGVSPVAGSALWPSLTAGATVLAPLVSASFLRLDVDGLVPLVRPTFVIDPLGTVHQPPVLTGRLAAGLEVRF